jgi:hypothetical protein
MTKKSEPWYIHAILYVVIAILLVVLIKVAIIDPADHIQKEEYYRGESILRMDNIRQAQILWQKKNEKFTDNLSELVSYVKNDSTVQQLIVGIDTLTNRSTNPFKSLTTGEFTPDSLMFSPKSHKPYNLQIDTTVTIDTVINRRGKIVRVDTTTVIGSLYFLECPDGYGTVGDLESPTLRNTASWE